MYFCRKAVRVDLIRASSAECRAILDRVGDGGRQRVWGDVGVDAQVHPPAGPARHRQGPHGGAPVS